MGDGGVEITFFSRSFLFVVFWLTNGLEVAGDELWLKSESMGSCLTNSDFEPEFERVELDSGEFPAAAKTENLDALSIKAVSEGKIGGGG